MGHDARVYGYGFPTAKAGGFLARTASTPSRVELPGVSRRHHLHGYVHRSPWQGSSRQCSGLDLGGNPYASHRTLQIPNPRRAVLLEAQQEQMIAVAVHQQPFRRHSQSGCATGCREPVPGPRHTRSCPSLKPSVPGLQSDDRAEFRTGRHRVHPEFSEDEQRFST
jgi:hypothetical protein